MRKDEQYNTGVVKHISSWTHVDGGKTYCHTDETGGGGGGIGDVIAIWDPASGIRYPSYNHRGDVVLVTDANAGVVERNEYTAFGAPVSGIWNPASGITAVGFSSKEHDTQSGLSYYGFRYYDPASARWMNKDSMLWYDNANVYSFVGHNPIHGVDWYGFTTRNDRMGGAEHECAAQYELTFLQIKADQMAELADALNPTTPKNLSKNALKLAKGQAKRVLKKAAKYGMQNAGHALEIVDAAQTFAEIASVIAKYLTPLELIWVEYCECLESAAKRFPQECIAPCDKEHEKLL